MNKKEHIKRHKELHKELDELVADFILETGEDLTDSSIMDLIEWSFEQTKNPNVIIKKIN